MTVHVKFMALSQDAEGTPQVAHGIVMNCPSVQELRDKLEEMGAAVIHAEEATAEEVAKAQAEQE